ncbi:MAG: hypothetical protein ACTSQK_02215 [Candidatus Heimdallarchaeota archaeon]
MSQEKIDSGTIILNESGAEIGVIKKIYSDKFARFELQNSDSIAFDPSQVTEINVSGRLLKKRSAKIVPEARIFTKGATETLAEVVNQAIQIIVEHLATKELKKALQHFEFDCLSEAEIVEKLPTQQAIGFIRGVQLAGKTPQDFIVKAVFQVSESIPELKSKLAPEIVVDKLNQDKAFIRILWNLLRVGIAQAIKIKDMDLVNISSEALLEIGLKFIEIEQRESGSSNDILFWQNRIKDCILKYIALMIINLEPENQQENLRFIKENSIEIIKSIKVHSSLKEQTSKLFEVFTIKEYENKKTIELIHSGVKGFNLNVMSEKKAMNELLDIMNSCTITEEKTNIVDLRKKIDKFTRETRGVSQEFIQVLHEISQFLKKIEYGDSKVQDYFAILMGKIHRRKYYKLSDLLQKLSNECFKQ